MSLATRSAALALTLGVAAASAAQAKGNPNNPQPLVTTALAQASSFTLQACGGSNFFTCLKAVVSIDVNAVLTMRVWNLSGTNGTYGGTVFTQMGLFGLPAGVAISTSNPYTGNGGNKVYHPTDGTTTWTDWNIATQGNGFSGAGITNLTLFLDTANGINGGLDAGQDATYQFQVTGLPSTFTLAENFAVHGQGGPNGCSTKLVITDGTPNSGPLDPACAITVAPEPATVGLMATGLVGLGLVGIRRRRSGAGGA